jgi:hypothetical protein
VLGLFRSRFEDPPEIDIESPGNPEKYVKGWLPKMTLKEGNHTDMEACLLSQRIHGKFLSDALRPEGVNDTDGDDFAL